MACSTRISAGDFVDVVAVLDTAPATALGDAKDAKFGVDLSVHAQIKAISQYILQKAEVLAVAQQLQGDSPPASSAQKAAQAVSGSSNNPAPPKQTNATQPAAHTVTLAVAAMDAEKLVLAEDKGHIRLVLRSHGDDSTMKLDDGLLSTLNGAAVLKSELKPL